MKKQKVIWSIEAGHSETIFDIRFKPTNSSILATGSYDGYIKIWDITTMKLLQSFTVHKDKKPQSKEMYSSIIYCLSWAPMDDRIISSHNNGDVIIWDSTKGKVLSKITSEDTSPIYRIDWNKLDDSLVAFGSTKGIWYFMIEI